MESEAALGTLPATSIGEIESLDLQDQSSNDVVRSFGVENGNALHISIDDHPITLPLFSPEEIFTNPSTYSREETIDCLQQGIGQFWADDLAAQQTNAGTNMQNPPQEQNPPHAPSATPELKPIPQAKARGVKRARARKTSHRAAKRPAEVKPEEPSKAKRPRYVRIAPKPSVPYQPQALPAVRGLGQQYNRQLQLAPLGTIPEGPSPMLPQQHAPVGINAGNIPSPHNGNMPRSSSLPPQQQVWMGTNPRDIPLPHNRNITWPAPMPPPQQLANGMTMGSMGYHQPEGNGIPVMYAPPSFSVGHIQPRVNGNATMHQYDGPMVNAPSSFMVKYQPRGVGGYSIN
ncbi:uncharacterized protein LW94_5459 [Fusarium fujikuroi]|nr:uncharacterized protein LW94_5459 [Fusarium fujikuroi]